MPRFLLAVPLALAVIAPAAAGTLTVKVTDSGGKPIHNAVVMLKVANGATKAPPAAPTFSIAQRDMQFHPFLSIVPAGTTIAFPNFDATKHHVYSFSPPKIFELKLYGKEKSRSIIFDKAGVVALGCNIHDSMSAYVFVTDSYWTDYTDANGNITFRDAPEKKLTITVWHPNIRLPGGTDKREVTIGGKPQSETFSLKMRAAPVRHMGNY
jgi:plastocyanin